MKEFEIIDIECTKSHIDVFLYLKPININLTIVSIEWIELLFDMILMFKIL